MDNERNGGVWGLALLVALLASASPAGAQPAFQCAASAGVPTRMRAEGRAELSADFMLNCAGSVPVPITGNVQIFLNTNITSRIVDPGTNATEALLTLDEAAPSSQVIGTNVFRGVVAGSNSLVWTNIPITPGGTSVSRTIRITNVRANASQIGVSASPTPQQVSMFVALTSTTAVPISNPTQVAGTVFKGLDFDLRNCADSGSANLTF